MLVFYLLIHVISGFQKQFDPKIDLKPFIIFFIAIAFSFTISELVKTKLKVYSCCFCIQLSFIFWLSRHSEYITPQIYKEVNSIRFL